MYFQKIQILGVFRPFLQRSLNSLILQTSWTFWALAKFGVTLRWQTYQKSYVLLASRTSRTFRLKLPNFSERVRSKNLSVLSCIYEKLQKIIEKMFENRVADANCFNSFWLILQLFNYFDGCTTEAIITAINNSDFSKYLSLCNVSLNALNRHWNK